MKKIFYLSLLIFLILFLIYLTKDHEEISNTIYLEDNIHIEFPSFSNRKINNYLNNLLSQKLSNFKTSNKETFFMDYDYTTSPTNTIALKLYNYALKDNIVKENITSYDINLQDSRITPTQTMSTSYEYDVYLGQEFDPDKPMIALTFDDGPNYNTNKIIDILNNFKVKATFFVLGQNIEGHEEILTKMANNNLEIGNHTYSHKLLTKMSPEKIQEEVNKTNDLITNITSKQPTLLRTSYGSFTKKIRSSVDMPIIIWNIDTLDWKYHSSERIANSILSKVKDGDIILMHDIYNATANALEIAIPKLLEQGYQLVTVSELFYYKNISLEKGQVYSNAK